MSTESTNFGVVGVPEELPITAAKFVRGADIILSPDPQIRFLVSDIAKHSDGSLLVGCNGTIGELVIVSNSGDAKTVKSFSSSISSITRGEDDYYIVLTDDGLCNIIQLYHENEPRFRGYFPHSVGVEEKCYQMRMTENFQAFSYMNGKLRIKTVKGACNHSPDIVEFKYRFKTQYARTIQLVHVNGEPVLYATGKSSEATHQVTKMSMTGEVLNIYNTLKFDAAGPIAVTYDGHVFVSFPDEHYIQLLTPDLSKGVTILDPTNDIWAPKAIYYCSNKKILYVANKITSKLMTFEVKY